MQRQERQQQAVRRQPEARDPLNPLARKHLGREQRSHAHEAVAKNINRIQEGIERHKQEYFDTRDPTLCNTWCDEGELHKIDNTDQSCIHRGEGDRSMTPNFPAVSGHLVNAHHQHQER